MKNNESLLFMGKLDFDIYGCISNEFISEDVIITQERISHIKERHPEAYNLLEKYGKVAIKDPDYILKSSKADTGVVLKQIEENSVKIQLVLRIATSRDENKMNSVLTFIMISERTWRKYLRNKEIIYKKEL